MIVLTLGSFDLVHFGHVDFLAQCAKFGDLMVGVNTDDFVASFKPERPIMSQEERVYAIGRLGYATVLNHSAGKDLIDKIRPDILIVGSDWARKDYYAQIDVTQDWLDERHITMAYIPYVQEMPISSSEIKRRVRSVQH